MHIVRSAQVMNAEARKTKRSHGGNNSFRTLLFFVGLCLINCFRTCIDQFFHRSRPFCRQMSDYLAVASGALPDWCETLTTITPVLFPFEARQTYFTATAFGLSRSAHWIQTRVRKHGKEIVERSEHAIGDVCLTEVIFFSFALFFFSEFSRVSLLHDLCLLTRAFVGTFHCP